MTKRSKEIELATWRHLVPGFVGLSNLDNWESAQLKDLSFKILKNLRVIIYATDGSESPAVVGWTCLAKFYSS